ncbi:MAG: HIT family protein [Endomicrobiia bacterium]
MERIFAPWRMKFITGKKEKGCLFCKKLRSKNDSKNLVLYRGKTAFILLNLYPYSNGHIMVAPKKHKGDFSQLTDEEKLELFNLVELSTKILKKVYKPKGFNIGINLGKVAGAGVPGHLHVHIVPRWLGDTNFMPVCSETKVICESLKSTYKKLRTALNCNT